jgi:hypothetical protein
VHEARILLRQSEAGPHTHYLTGMDTRQQHTVIIIIIIVMIIMIIMIITIKKTHFRFDDSQTLERLEILVQNALACSQGNGDRLHICHFEFSFLDSSNQRNEVLIVGSCKGVSAAPRACVCMSASVLSRRTSWQPALYRCIMHVTNTRPSSVAVLELIRLTRIHTAHEATHADI